MIEYRNINRAFLLPLADEVITSS